MRALIGSILRRRAKPEAIPDRIRLDPKARSIELGYETRAGSAQTIADIFQGSWKSRLPLGLVSGDMPMFDDHRPAWFASVLPGGVTGRSILELGPFEGYQTHLLDRLGASEIVSVEGNRLSFLKCLCVKEMLGTRAVLKHGSIIEELRCPGRDYDVVWASGVLYHMQDPVEFVELACRAARFIYMWTHVWDAAAMSRLDPAEQGTFVTEFDRTIDYKGERLVLHARDYKVDRDTIDVFWEGAPQDRTNWLSLEDLSTVFRLNGFRIAHTEFVGELNGLPLAAFAAFRN